MVRFLARLLNLHRGDLSRGVLLFAYLFLVMSSYLVARVARDALFLDQYKAIQLPFADLAIAVLTGFAISAYLWIARPFTLQQLLTASLLFCAANCALFWYLAHFHDLPWLYPVIYVWVGIFGVLAPAQVWTLANFVLTTREAKRVFGFIGSGSISGAIIGGKYSNLAARAFGTESLLLGIAVALTICAGLVPLIWRQRQQAEAVNNAAVDAEPEGAEGAQRKSVRESLRLIWSDPYLRAITLLILVASIVTSMAGWQFKALAKMFIPQKDALAAFFGDFYFYAGIAGLLVQLLVTSRLLRRFGLGPALFVVPTALLFGSVGILVWGAATIWAAIALRSGINVLQYSIDKPTVELLYLPVPSSIKIQAKSFIDTVIWRFGDGLSAVLLLAFATTLGWSTVQVSWVNMVIIVGWFVAAAVARQRYVNTLRQSIHEYRLDSERIVAPVLDRSTKDILAANLCATDPKEILYALSLLEVEHKGAVHPAVRDLLNHPAPEVRQKAVVILREAGDKTVRQQMEELLKDPNLAVRTEALLYLTHHAQIDPLRRIEEVGDFPDYSIRSAMVAFLARPGPSQNLVAAQALLDAMAREAGEKGCRTRLEAARLLGTLPAEFDEQLRILLTDAHPDVLRHAIHAVGLQRNRRFLVRLFERLAEPDFAADAAEALTHFGDHVVGTLRDYLGDPQVPIEARRQIPAVLVRIGTPAAGRVLVQNLLEGDTTLRFRIISALNKLHQLHPELELDTLMIETVLAAEIMGHYRAYQILGTLGGSLDSGEAVVKALRQSMQDDIERIFRLLGLLFPHFDFHSAYVGLQSPNIVVHDNALEFLDNILKPQLRNVLVPLLDSEVATAERIQRANRMVGAKVENREEAVAALLASEDPWLKSCGAYAVGLLGLRVFERELDACLDHADPLLRETARQAKLRLGGLARAPAPAD